MPFYEYQCRACGALTEVLQKVADPPLRKCPECGRNQLVKLVSAPVFRLKGGGWYETDFKSDGENKRNLVEKDEAPASGDAKADAKDAKGTKDEKPAAEKKTEGTAESGAKQSAEPAAKSAPKPAPGPAATKKRAAAKPRRSGARGRR